MLSSYVALQLRRHPIFGILTAASSHITGVREHLIDFRDTEVKIEIALGDDTLVRVAGIGTITFRRDSMPPISFRDVLYVPGLKKNLISVSTLHDRGLEVTFRGTKVLIHPQGSSLASGQVIGVRDGKLFRLLFQPRDIENVREQYRWKAISPKGN